MSVKSNEGMQREHTDSIDDSLEDGQLKNGSAVTFDEAISHTTETTTTEHDTGFDRGMVVVAQISLEQQLSDTL